MEQEGDVCLWPASRGAADIWPWRLEPAAKAALRDIDRQASDVRSVCAFESFESASMAVNWRLRGGAGGRQCFVASQPLGSRHSALDA